MAIDFPNSPTTGQIYTVGDKSWIWDGSVWKAYGASLSPTVLKVDSTNSRVGINNQSPATALDIVGTTTVRAATSQDGVRLEGRSGGTGNYYTTLVPTTLTGFRQLNLPDKDGLVATTADIGLRRITSGTFSAASSVSINNCFSSDYTNYRVVFGNITQSTTLVLRIRMRLSGTDNTAGVWDYAFPYLYASGAAVSVNAGTAQTGLYVGDTNSSSNSVASFSFDVYQPNVARRTIWLGHAINIYNAFFSMAGGGAHNVETAYDGFTLYTSTGNITGNYQVYGYAL
jgi:hypothetical protein